MPANCEERLLKSGEVCFLSENSSTQPPQEAPSLPLGFFPFPPWPLPPQRPRNASSLSGLPRTATWQPANHSSMYLSVTVPDIGHHCFVLVAKSTPPRLQRLDWRYATTCCREEAVNLGECSLCKSRVAVLQSTLEGCQTLLGMREMAQSLRCCAERSPL